MFSRINTKTGRSRLIFYLAILAFVVLAGCTAAITTSGRGLEDVIPAITGVPSPETSPTAGPSPSATSIPTASPTPDPTATPSLPDLQTTEEPSAATNTEENVPSHDSYQIEIPKIGVSAEVVLVGRDPDGAMSSPPGPNVVGLYMYGPRPGQKSNVLLSGHLDWLDRQTGVARTAIFWRLKELAPGDEVIFYADGDTKYTYKVTKSLKYRFDDPAALTTLQPSDKPMVTLITCEGPGFDPATRNYTYRRIVVAEMINPTP